MIVISAVAVIGSRNNLYLLLLLMCISVRVCTIIIMFASHRRMVYVAAIGSVLVVIIASSGFS